MMMIPGENADKCFFRSLDHQAHRLVWQYWTLCPVTRCSRYSEYVDNLLGSVLVRVSFLLRKLNKTQGGSTKYKIPGRAHKTGPVVVGLLFPIWGSLYCNTVLWLQIENGWISLLSWVSWWRHLQNYVDEASIPSFASQSVSQSLNTNAQNKFLTAFLIYFIFSHLSKNSGKSHYTFASLSVTCKKIKFCRA